MVGGTRSYLRKNETAKQPAGGQIASIVVYVVFGVQRLPFGQVVLRVARACLLMIIAVDGCAASTTRQAMR